MYKEHFSKDLYINVKENKFFKKIMNKIYQKVENM